MCGAGQNRVARPFQRLVGQDGEEAPPWRRMRSDTLFLTYRAQRVKNEAARRFRARRVKNEAARPLRASRDRHLPKTIKMHYDVHPFSGLLFQEGGAARLALMRSDTLIFPNRAHRRSDTLFFSNRAQRRSDTLFWPVHAQMGSDHHILNPPCPAGPEWVGGAHFPLGLEIEIGQKDRTALHNRPAATAPPPPPPSPTFVAEARRGRSIAPRKGTPPNKAGSKAGDARTQKDEKM